ncbi:DUF11 domain-containing protein [Methanothermobacter marburgensis]|uniref:DUF11 domain-containing protein n=1 Tax=Methanothermobacter marburgensis (strain ATCC BAA-927 / DSM 2133 / JCM 14651 / NBRC 100331 / OCM 82 / Marburg) TaxID=79929 RepID=D9PXU4_METTM|nr:DUF11 domain-containing protein [Methanothermobacter marburgensis]ADL59042.1 conserved hypothetical protein [Methanothermobacter marburgensis str. Marburg]WBF09571.1 DUF11 domain-containing protein [Methanothermobacter marburgensis]
MRKFTLTLALLLLMVAVGTASAADTDNQTDSDSVITGTVTYCNSTEPFEGAVINVASMNGSNLASGVTGPDGRYSVSLQSPDRTFVVSAVAPGHVIPSKTVTLDESGRATADFKLGTLQLTKGSWDTLGLDNNNVNVGPNQYLIQIRVKNNALTTANNVTANLTFTSINPYIYLAANETPNKYLGDIPPGVTVDVFYLVEVSRNTLAYLTSRNYTVMVGGTNTGSADTINGTLYVEKLVSQNRNDVVSITVSNPTPAIGDVIAVTVVSTTASATYDVVNLPLTNYNPAILQPLNVTVTYGSNTSNNVRLDSPGQTNFVSVWLFNVTGAGVTSLFGLITDRSGSSYHYNSDFGENITIKAVEKADLAIAKTVDNATPNIGDTVTFTLTVVNYGPNNGTGVYVIDKLPAGLQFVSATASKGTYNNNTGIWTIGNLNYFETVTLNITAMVEATGIIVNNANVTGDVFDPNMANNYASVTLNSPPASDLTIDKSVSNPEPYVGETIQYTITVSNRGPDNAPGVVVEDILPAGLILVSATPSKGIYTMGTWYVGTLNYLEVATLTILAKVNATGILTNFANVTSPNFDPNLDNNNVTRDVCGIPVADLRIIKNVNNPRPNFGSNVTFTVAVTNLGPSTATGVNVTDILSPGLVYLTHTVTQGSYDPLTGVWTIGTLNYAASALMNLTVLVNTTGDSNNTVLVTGNEYDPDRTNNDAISVLNAVSADLSIQKTVDRPVINNGETATFTVTVRNAGPDTPSNVVVTDLLPAGLSIISYTVTQGTFSEATRTWNVGSLPALFQATLTLFVRATQAGFQTNIVNVSSELPDPMPQDNVDAVTVDVRPSADVKITKTVSNTAPDFGETVVFYITVTNLGPDTATVVRTVDGLPAGLIYQSHVASAGVYFPEFYVWTVDSLAPGASETLNLTALVDATGELINTVSVTATEYDPDMTNNYAAAVINGRPLADIAVQKTVLLTPIKNGQSTNFTVTVTNNGPNDATGVTVTDILPAALTIVSSEASQGTFAGGVWTVGNLANGSSATLVLEVLANAAGIFTNYVNASADDQYDPDISNNNATAVLTVDPAADVAVTKTVSNSTPNFGDLITFYVTVMNNGPDNATGITLTESLPAGLVYVSHAISQGVCYPLACIWIVGDLAPGSSATLNFTVLVNRTGDVVNRVLAVGEEFDPYPENNTAEVTVRVPAAAYLVIDKVVNATVANFTDTVRFTVSVRNDGPDTAAGVVVTDLLPAGLVYLSHVASQGTYDSVTGAWMVGSVVKDAVATLEIVARVAVSNTTLVNIADVTADTYNPNPDTSANATVTVNPRAELTINKTVDRRAVRVGQNVRFTITVTNNGPDTALNTMVTDRLPDAMRYISSNATMGSYNPATGVWMVGDLPAGSSAVLDIVVQLIRRGTFVNVATVSSGSSGGNNTTDVEIDVEPSPGPGPSPGPSPGPRPVPMKPTGAPLTALVAGMLLVAAGSAISRRK